MPEIGTKKVAVVLLACGIYKKMGLGPVADTHVIKFVGSIVKCICGMELEDSILKSIVEAVAVFVPIDPGIFTK